MKKGGNKWIAFDFDTTLKTDTITKTVTNGAERNETVALKTKSINKNSKQRISFNFNEKLLPKTVKDLAVHPKKIKDVELWLQQNVISPRNKPFSPILLLTGPTGAGKTATINVLCKELGIQLVEWINPLDHDYEIMFGDDQVTRFLDFFTQSKYGSLCEDPNGKKLSLVEDFPNFVTYNPSEFAGILEKCYNGSSPVAFICTDTNNSKLDLAQTLFPQDVRDKFQITNISFNPCSATLLKSALKRAHDIMQSYSDLFNLPSPEVVEAIVISTMGDIRCALTQYHFAGLKGVSEIPMIANSSTKSIQGTKRKRANLKPTPTIKSMVKDECVGFFHGLGRVLNPKRIEVGNSWKIQCDFDVLVDQFSTRPSNFNAFLHENYLKYFTNIRDVERASDVLSFAQTFYDKWTEQQETFTYALWIAVLGLMIYNEHKASKWNQIKGPTKVKLNLESHQLNRMDYSYYNIITRSKKYHIFKSE